MKKNIIFFFVIILCGCTKTYDDGILCKYLYFPTSTNKNCFWVEVKEDRTLKEIFGEMSWDCHDSISSGKFPKDGILWEKIHDEDSIIIDATAFRQLEELVSEVRKRKSVNYFIQSISHDGMGNVLFIKDRAYYFEIGIYDDKPTMDFIDKLKETSPIPIRSSWGSVLQKY